MMNMLKKRKRLSANVYHYNNNGRYDYDDYYDDSDDSDEPENYDDYERYGFESAEEMKKAMNELNDPLAWERNVDTLEWLVTVTYDIEAIDISEQLLKMIQHNNAKVKDFILNKSINRINDTFYEFIERNSFTDTSVEITNFKYVEGSSKLSIPRRISKDNNYHSCRFTCTNKFTLSLEVNEDEISMACAMYYLGRSIDGGDLNIENFRFNVTELDPNAVADLAVFDTDITFESTINGDPHAFQLKMMDKNKKH